MRGRKACHSLVFAHLEVGSSLLLDIEKDGEASHRTVTFGTQIARRQHLNDIKRFEGNTLLGLSDSRDGQGKVTGPHGFP